jgi:hypothetical protein
MAQHSQQVSYRPKFLTIAFVLLAAFLSPLAAPAQNSINGMLIMGSNDIAAIKRRAEAGDASAQMALADALTSSFRYREALDWYRKAALQGHTEARYHLGEALLRGRSSIVQGQSVKQNVPDGIRWIYMAATNGYPQAAFSMARVLSEPGWGGTNLIAAYAWYKFASSKSGGGRVEMNNLALKMDTASLTQAEALAARFQAGEWRTVSSQTLPQGDPRLKLSGITFGGQKPLAVISGKTLSEGESTTLPLKSGAVVIKCLKIEKDSVLVALQGEDTPRRLSLR